MSPAEHITRDALAAVDGRVGATSRILVRDADIPLIGIERAIVNEFDRDGVPVKVDEGLGYQFGYSRTARPETVDEVWYVVELGQSLSLLADLPGATVLWNASPLSAAEEAELQAGQRELYAALQDAGRPDLYFRLQSPLVGFALARHRRRRSRDAATGRRPEFEGGGVGRLPLRDRRVRPGRRRGGRGRASAPFLDHEHPSASRSNCRLSRITER